MMKNVWTVILAAGEGRRLSSVTGGVPKQFWRAPGGRSLLSDTQERFAPLSPISRTVIVVDRTHRQQIASAVVGQPHGSLVYQPVDRGTAVGVLLGLTPIVAIDPDALIVMTPADHGVADSAVFRSGLVEGIRHVEAINGIVLFGVEPIAPSPDYGWISTGRASGASRIRSVTAFSEKPSLERAAQLFASGGVWNTMVITARARTLRDLCLRHLPELKEIFVRAEGLAAAPRARYLEEIYPTLPKFDFSRDVLTPADLLQMYVWPVSMGWSDLGTPERLFEWQSRRSVGQRTTSAA